MTLDHTIVRAVIKNFPHVNGKYDSLPDLSKDIETLRECHAFFMRLASGDPKLSEEVEELMTTWRRDLNAQMCKMVEDRGQKKLI